MIDLLLDTNIIIYAQKYDPIYMAFIAEHAKKEIGISIITYMEVLMGTKTKQEWRSTADQLASFDIIPLHKEIGELVTGALLSRKSKNIRDPHLADSIIANTALLLDVPLATNNPKDFKTYKGLKLVVP